MCTSTVEERSLAIWIFVSVALVSTIATLSALCSILKRGDARKKFKSMFTVNILLSDLFHACGGFFHILVWNLSPLETDNICDVSTWDNLRPAFRVVFIVSLSVAALGFASSAIWIASVTYSLWKMHESGWSKHFKSNNMSTFHSFAWSIGERVHIVSETSISNTPLLLSYF
jgi:hypothetical protein